MTVEVEHRDPALSVFRLAEPGTAATAPAGSGAWQELLAACRDAGNLLPAGCRAAPRRDDGTDAVASTSVLARACALDGHMPVADTAAPRPADALAASGSAAEAIGMYLRAQRDTLIELDPAVRSDAPGAAPRMRVDVQRLRSTLVTFGSLIDRSGVDNVDADLGWLVEELDRVCNAAVVSHRLTVIVEAEPSGLVLGPIAVRLTDLTSAGQLRHRDALLAAVTSQRYAALLDGVDAVLAAPASDHGRKPAKAEVPRLVRKAVRRADRAIAAATRARTLTLPPTDPVGFPLPGVPDRTTALRAAGEAAEQARYAAEAAVPVAGRDAVALAVVVAAVQDLLAEHHDSVLTRAVLHDAGVAAYEAGENAFSYGVLYARQSAAAERLEAALPKLWSRAKRGKARGWLH